MKKNFLLLMLMALLPLSGWATITITTQPAISDAVDYDGNAKSAITAAAAAASTNVPTISYAVTSSTKAPAVDDEIWTTTFAEATATNAGTYYVYVMVTAEEEETLRQYVGTFTINKVDPTATAPAAVTADLTYNGTAQTIVATEASTEHGTLTYSLTEDGTFTPEAPKATDAGTYKLFYKVTGDNNHKDKVFSVDNFKTIGAKTLNTTDFTVTRSVASANYSGELQNCPYVVTYTEGDWTETLELTDDYTVAYSGTGPTAVGTYTATITGAGNFTGSLDNTALNGMTAGLGSWEITKKPITVRALDQTKVYDGTADLPSSDADVAYQIIGVVGDEAVGAPTLTVGGKAVGEQTVTPSGCTGANVGNYEINYVAATLTITKKTGLVITADDANKNKGTSDPSIWGLTLTGSVSSDDTNIKEACTVTRAEGEAAGTYAINVTVDDDADVIKNYDYEVVAGTFTINGGKMLITVEPKSKTYGEADPEFTYILSNNDGNALTNEPTLTRVAGENVGTYTISATGAEAPAGYEGVEYVEAALTINKATLKVVINDQTLKVGDSEDALDQTACTVTGLVKNTELEIDDTTDPTAVFLLKFKSGVSTSSAAVTNDGITAELQGTSNYEWADDQTNGKLIVVAAATVVLSKTDDNTITAGDGVDVTFDSFALAANRWYAMVLPFDITPATLTGAFGYAVTDVLDQTNSSESKVRFVLNMTTIPAHTPFIFKLSEATNMNAGTFSSVNVTVPGDDDLVVEDAAGNQFIGTYAGMSFATPDKDYLISITDGDIHPAAAGAKLRPLGAYIKTVATWANAPVFEIEEIDGSVTTIKAIESVNAEVATDGWYTVNGIRLEGAPTEKGIYIRNGKKIVIK